MLAKILVVEDDKSISDLITLHLKKNDFEYLVVHNGEDALSHLDNFMPDFIILDWMIPGLSGLEVLRRIRNKQEYKNLPILMLTAKNSEQDKIISFESGLDDYITKPFLPSELIARVKAILKRTSQLNQDQDNLIFNEIKKNHSSTLREEDFKLNSKKLKIGYLKNLFDEDTSRYKQNNQLTLDLIKETFNLTPIRLPSDYPFGAFDIILRAEAGAFFDSFILNNLDSTMVEQGERSRANSLRQSRLIPAVEYIQANRYRSVLIEEVKTLFESFDIILSPSFGKNQLMITNLIGHPAISVPNGFDNKKRPTSISLIGNYYEEHKILYFADILQNKTNYHKKIPPGFE